MKAFLLLICAAASALGATFTESFETLPTGWRTYGPFTSAFVWNAGTQNLGVTWDSRQPNTFVTRALPFPLRRSDAFSAELTLTLSSVRLGIDPTKPNTFPLTFGFINIAEALRENYYRGSGVNAQTGARSIVEFAYFPDAGLDATIGPIIASTNNRIAFAHTHPMELVPGETYRIRIAFDPAAQQLHTTVLRNGESIGPIRSVMYPASYGDFRADAFSIQSYSHAGQSPPDYAGSLLADGIIDDIVVTYPDPPRVEMTGVKTESSFIARSISVVGWIYALQRTQDFVEWTSIQSLSGTGGLIELIDSTPPADKASYRIAALRAE